MFVFIQLSKDSVKVMLNDSILPDTIQNIAIVYKFNN